MTYQIGDVLVFGGQTYEVASLPLEDLPEGRVPDLTGDSTSCWRGYIAHWLIEDGKLWLTAFTTQMPMLSSGCPRWATMQDVFPGCGERVWADWYSGAFYLQQGEKLGEDWLGSPVCERTITLGIEGGKLVASNVRTNDATRVSLLPGEGG